MDRTQERTRRSNAGLPRSQTHLAHHRIARLSKTQGQTGDASKIDEDAVKDSGDEDETERPFLCKTRQNQNTTRIREGAPVNQPLGSTVPTYNRTMYNFTLGRLRDSAPYLSDLPRSSGSSGGDSAVLSADLSKLTLDEAPHAPSNTPTPAHQRDMFQKMKQSPAESLRSGKRRSLTDSLLVAGAAGTNVAQDFAVAT